MQLIEITLAIFHVSYPIISPRFFFFLFYFFFLSRFAKARRLVEYHIILFYFFSLLLFLSRLAKAIGKMLKIERTSVARLTSYG